MALLNVSVTCLGTSACDRAPPPKIGIAAVERCEDGIAQAAKQGRARNARRIVYSECADLYAQPRCRDAFRRAAELGPAQQVSSVLLECANAYCPLLETEQLAACSGSVLVNENDAAKAWAALNTAILKRDAGGYAPRVALGFAIFDANVKEKKPAPLGAPRAAASDIAACEAATNTALSEPGRRAARRISALYCSPVYSEPACRDALLAGVNAPPDQQLAIPFKGCRDAYCPRHKKAKLDVCGFKEDLSRPSSVAHAWQDLNESILEFEAGMESPRLVDGMRLFEENLKARPPEAEMPSPRVLAAADCCEDGIIDAQRAATRLDALRLYREACAPVYVEPECRDAMVLAAHEPGEEPTPRVFASCRTAYCKVLPQASTVAACASTFAVTEGSTAAAWPELNRAMLQYELGGDAERISLRFNRLQMRLVSEAAAAPSLPAANSRPQSPGE